MPRLIRAILAEGPNRHSLVEIPAPTPKKDELLVKPAFSGICGSDVKILAGQVPDIGFPLVPGHEWVGEVVDAGANSRSWIGKMIVSDILQNCGLCAPCNRGLHSLCESMVEPGINAQGSMADQMVVRADKAIRFPDGLSADTGSLVEPLSVALHALERATPTAGRDVVLFGAGGIGLLLLQALRLYEVRSVTVVEPLSSRRSAALRCGADRVLDPADGPIRDLWGTTNGLEPHLAIEAAGSLAAFNSCIDVVGKAGVVAVVGYPPASEGTTAIDPSLLVRKRIDVRGILSPAASWHRAVELLSEGKIVADAILTHRFPLDRFDEALALATSRDDGAIRVLVHD